MNEIVYYGTHNKKYGAIANANTISKVKFTLNNENMEVQVFDIAGGKYEILCDFTTLHGTSDGTTAATKNECFNPINAAEWAMYPVCAASGGAAGGKSLTLDLSLIHI